MASIASATGTVDIKTLEVAADQYGGAVIAPGQSPARAFALWIKLAGISTFFAIQ